MKYKNLQNVLTLKIPKLYNLIDFDLKILKLYNLIDFDLKILNLYNLINIIFFHILVIRS
jgi:hypothetical protein